MVLTGTAVATVALRELDDILDPIRQDGRADIDVPELDIPDPGGPRTFMVLGSDAREGADAGMSPRSDTILLARADPDKDAIAVMSIPRDLKVEIPGHGEGKINSAFELGGKKGGPRLVVRTVKKLFEDATGENFPITNVMIMDYGAFRRAVNYIDGVYVDIDRDYFNDNSSGENYATIDINPGYQMLKGKDALDYVRYRHTDNDLVRAARQQDFLRQAKNAAGVRKLLASGLSETRHLIRVFSRYFRVDKSLRSNKQIISMLKLVLYLAQREPEGPRGRVQGLRRAEPAARLEPRTTATATCGARSASSCRSRSRPRRASRRTTAEPPAPDRQSARERARERRARERKPAQVAGLEDARREGEDQAVIADPKLKFPFYFPDRARGRAPSTRAPSRAIYKIKDERGKKREAYRLVLSTRRIGEYYGVQGLAWKAPPILDDPDRTIRRGNRKFRLYYDGKRLRLVAWRTKRGVYWISNTLTQSIGEDQMIAIASSLKRLKQ